MFFPITALVVGLAYKNDCPIEPWIPRWLWIFGSIGLSAFGFLAFIVNKLKKRNRHSKIKSKINFILELSHVELLF